MNASTLSVHLFNKHKHVEIDILIRSVCSLPSTLFCKSKSKSALDRLLANCYRKATGAPKWKLSVRSLTVLFSLLRTGFWKCANFLLNLLLMETKQPLLPLPTVPTGSESHPQTEKDWWWLMSWFLSTSFLSKAHSVFRRRGKWQYLFTFQVCFQRDTTESTVIL